MFPGRRHGGFSFGNSRARNRLPRDAISSAGDLTPILAGGSEPAADRADILVGHAIALAALRRFAAHEASHFLEQLTADPDDCLVGRAKVFLRTVDDRPHADHHHEILDDDFVESGAVAGIHDLAVLTPIAVLVAGKTAGHRPLIGP